MSSVNEPKDVKPLGRVLSSTPSATCALVKYTEPGYYNRIPAFSQFHWSLDKLPSRMETGNCSTKNSKLRAENCSATAGNPALSRADAHSHKIHVEIVLDNHGSETA